MPLHILVPLYGVFVAQLRLGRLDAHLSGLQARHHKHAAETHHR